MKISRPILIWSVLAAIIPTLIGVMIVYSSMTGMMMPGVTMKDLGLMLGTREVLFGVMFAIVLVKRKYEALLYLLLFRGLVDGSDAFWALTAGRYSGALVPAIAAALSLTCAYFLYQRIKSQ